MGARMARLSDVITLHHLERTPSATVLAPVSPPHVPSAELLILDSVWRPVGGRAHSLVLSGRPRMSGFAQALSRPGRESWDIVRLACHADQGDESEAGCAELLNEICWAIAQRGALRAFMRVPSGSSYLPLFMELGFRPYAAETTLLGTLRQFICRASAPCAGVRARIPRDAWDIFSLYCAVTPALVRHAEARGLREWSLSGHAAARALRRCRAPREVVVGEAGHLTAWARWRGGARRTRVLEVLARPEAAPVLLEMLGYAVNVLGLDPDRATLCRTREYDGRVSATLEEAGFVVAAQEVLLVRHSAARVSERQLLVAAVRAQGLGIEVSHHLRRADPAQRLASSREAAQQ